MAMPWREMVGTGEKVALVAAVEREAGESEWTPRHDMADVTNTDPAITAATRRLQ